MRIPSDAEIRALHEKHAPTREAFDLVHTHCEIVCAIAERLLDGLDAALVRAGALLHDIGVYRLYEGGELDHSRYIRHGMLGHDLLAEEGFPEPLRRFCSCHVGVGLTSEDVRRAGLPLPVADYLPESGAERLVMYADKFHTKSTPPTFVTADAYAVDVRRFGADKPAAFAALRREFGEPDLAPLAEAYGHAVRRRPRDDVRAAGNR
jgi:uncharacterized protein